MKVSTKGRYGLRAMLELALGFGQGPMLVETISSHQGISGKYIHNLMTTLKSAGLVRAERGPKGGYLLARDPSQITLREIIEPLEGRLTPVECVADEKCCPRFNACAATDVWQELAVAVQGVLAGITLEQLADRQRAKQPAEPMYHI